MKIFTGNKNGIIKHALMKVIFTIRIVIFTIRIPEKFFLIDTSFQVGHIETIEELTNIVNKLGCLGNFLFSLAFENISY